MDDKVRELLNRVKETASIMSDVAGTTARTAGRYAGQMVDIAKLNMRIFDLNTECSDLLRAVGQMVYDAHLGQSPEDDSLTALLTRLDEAHAGITELKTRIATLRSSHVCPACGALCGREDKYCRDCGAAL